MKFVAVIILNFIFVKIVCVLKIVWEKKGQKIIISLYAYIKWYCFEAQALKVLSKKKKINREKKYGLKGIGRQKKKKKKKRKIERDLK